MGEERGREKRGERREREKRGERGRREEREGEGRERLVDLNTRNAPSTVEKFLWSSKLLTPQKSLFLTGPIYSTSLQCMSVGKHSNHGYHHTYHRYYHTGHTTTIASPCSFNSC